MIIRLFSAAIVLSASQVLAADPWADRVVSYTPGSGIGADFVTGDLYDDPSVSLGEPTRFTSDMANFGGAVTPFNSPFRANEIVTVGGGGSLTVAFDEPVVDDPLNPFGIDLLIFGNAFLFDADFPNGIAGALASEGGIIEVSENGVDFFAVPGVEADGAFPTLGYTDTGAFSDTAGSSLTDFTLPVDPSFDLNGLDFSQIVTGYNGSGGGAGVDLATVGLSQISYVRISTAAGAQFFPKIDALADVRAVPEPISLVMAGFCLAVSFAAPRVR